MSGTVQAGGTLVLDPGGVASGTAVASGGTLLLSGVTVSAGAVVTAGFEAAEATISGVDVAAGAIVDYSALTWPAGAWSPSRPAVWWTGRLAAGGSAYVGSGGTLLLDGVVVSSGRRCRSGRTA